MARGRGYVALILGVLMTLLPSRAADAQSGRSGKTVTIVVGKSGDHWADILDFTYIGPAHQNGVYGYRVTLRAVDGCEWTHFYPRAMIDFRGDSPGFRRYKVRVATGWLYFPDRLTAKSLPKVYWKLRDLDAYYARQGDGAIAAMEGFALVAAAGTLVPGPRVPVGAPRSTAGGAAVAGRAAAARGTIQLPHTLRGGVRNAHVYLGVRNGRPVYVGISKDLARRQAQHGGRFVIQRITPRAVTRGEARAIEQALISRYPGYENIRNSIDPKQPYFRQALDWGEAWLKRHGF